METLSRPTGNGMMGFEDTTLWQTTLAKREGSDPHEDARELLRSAFRQMRERARLLSEGIAKDNPSLTVHDITHLDALWEMASLVAGPGYSLSPSDAFVLGAAFLVHDLAMSYVCYPDLAELRNEPRWRDRLCVELQHRLGRSPKQSEIESIDEPLRHEVDAAVMHEIHAKKAEELPHQEWKANGTSFYLIDSPELRQSFGSVIGKIAHSHWWDASLLPSEFSAAMGAPSQLPANWGLDPLKVAFLLRVADATHIDERRAPSFVFALRQPPDGSRQHWEFQNLLLRPRLSHEELVYSSKRPFGADEAEAWWLCFDTLQLADRELRKADEILLKTDRARFVARGIADSDSPRRIATTVPTKGWEPIDAKIRVTNVAALADRLGGRQLYGDEGFIPLRELIQNASDAIRARRILENRSAEWGTITVRSRSTDGSHYLEVSDDGIGMSQDVLSGPLLDFGASYWGTPLMMREYPGLLAKGFRSTGQYGIGFFSVFMWADQVSVVTRRCQDPQKETRVLEFQGGLPSRPLLRFAELHEQRLEPGTTVRLKLRKAPTAQAGFLRLGRFRREWKLRDLCEWLFPAIDANLSCEFDGDKSEAVASLDWITLDGVELVGRIFADERPRSRGMAKLYGRYVKGLRPMLDTDGNVIGRAVVCPRMFGRKDGGPGLVTTNGIRAETVHGIMGILQGVSVNAPRDLANPIVDEETLAKWATEQARLVLKFLRSREEKREAASIIAACGGDTGQLPVARVSGGWISAARVRKQRLPAELLIIDDDDRWAEGSKTRKLEPNVFAVSNGDSYWGVLERRRGEASWPPVPERFREYKIQGEEFSPIWFVLVEAIAQSWKVPLREVMTCSSLRTRNKGERRRVGMRGKRAERVVADIIRKPN
jgi:hypothetical protein